MGATAEWTAMLQGWAMPQPILDAAPADPYALPAAVISAPQVDSRTTPTGLRVLERLAPGERLLDVGCGTGRISGAFTADHEVIGVEPRAGAVDGARAAGIDARVGRWPDLAPQVGTAPVVLSTHVLYDVQEPADFLKALNAAATRRVVLELPLTHPWSGLTPYFRHFHDLDRPDGPSVDVLGDVIGEVLGVTPHVTRWSQPSFGHDTLDDLVAAHRRMLCLSADADQELSDLLAPQATTDASGRVRLGPRELATLHWDTDLRP